MSLAYPPLFFLAERDGARLTLRSAAGHEAHLFVLEQDVIRVLVLPAGRIAAPQSWSICPGGEDIDPAGRDRFDLKGFTQPAFKTETLADVLVIETAQLRLTVAWRGLFCSWETRIGGLWLPAARDRATQNVNFGELGPRVCHYLQRERREIYLGLGEKAGPADRHGRRYRMTNIDAMGYDARSTDPLYKHVPFYLSWHRDQKVPLGIFYDTMADCVFDMGCELDNYHGLYRYFEATDGDLDYYVIGGDSLAAISRRYCWLTGRPAFMPKWSLGYSGSTMSYTDAPDAQIRMEEFIERCRQHDMLCESFHLSSGYTSIGAKRYVFTWNKEKFPDPAGFVQSYLRSGIKLCANIKPCLLGDHPKFAEAAQDGLFIHEPDGKPAMVQFWDETGAYLDFTNAKTRAWWKDNLSKSLLEIGVAASWNDNNEFELWDHRARIDNFGASGKASAAKPLQTLLMIQASRQAQAAHAPGKRPFLISRAGCAGMQRYVQTWSGDNSTSWETLKFNIRMGTGLAVSGVSNTGHDIGGFTGPAPEPELFLRWVQSGIFLPRFSIHSWNDDGSVNEPWMYPQLVPAISALIKLRARLVPYLYHLAWRSHTSFEPMIRPTWYEFPDDPLSFRENDEMLLGPDLLLAPIVEPGQSSRRVHLPRGANWVDYWRGSRHAGGTEVEIPVTESAPVMLVREGAIIPLNLAEQHFATPADERGFALFPAVGDGSSLGECFEDDGESEAYRQGGFGLWRVKMTSSATELTFGIVGPAKVITLLLPKAEKRPVKVTPAATIQEDVWEQWRRLRVEIKTERT